jgi:RimJ/RimL family protein N-acetyltransferase
MKEGADIIETNRLLLRRFRRRDVTGIFRVLSNAEVMRFSLNGPYSREKCEGFIEACLATYERRGTGLLAVALKESGKVIGYCGFHFQTIDSKEEIEIGYRLHPEYWNRGLATEAAKRVQDFGFEKLGFDRMISIIEARNAASIRVAEKCGMEYAKDALFKGRVPVRIYAIERK